MRAYFSVRVPIVDQNPGTSSQPASGARRGLAGDRALTQRVAPMLDAQGRPAARFSARHTSPAASRPSGAVRMAALDGDRAALELQPGLGRELGPGRHAGRHHDDV